MNSGRVPPTAVPAKHKDTAQLSLGLAEPSRREVSFVYGGSAQSEDSESSVLSPDRDQVAERGKATGLEAAERGDPEGFEGAIAAIRKAAEEFSSFSADDLAWSSRGPEVGAAFSALRKSGEIERCGYAISRRPQAHGRLVRVWRST